MPRAGRAVVAAAMLLAGGVALAAPASADLNSFLASVHAQGITSPKGDQGLFNAGTFVCKQTAFYLRYDGDFSSFGARRKAAEDLVNNELDRPRNDSIVVTNTAIDELCPQYNYTWAAQ